MFKFMKHFGKSKRANAKVQRVEATDQKPDKNFLLFYPVITEIREIEKIIMSENTIALQVTEQDEDSIRVSLEGKIVEGNPRPYIETEAHEGVLMIHASCFEGSDCQEKAELERIRIEVPKRLMGKVVQGKM